MPLDNPGKRQESRRDFLKKSALAAAGVEALALGGGLAMPTPAVAAPAKPGAGKAPWQILSAYYFRGHMYTSVPSAVRDDMAWMAQQGTDAVCIGILEQDLDAAIENVDRICTEANRVGMKVFAVPSRWGNILAGSLKVPSTFTCKNRNSWILDSKGNPKNTGFGMASSVHYPEVVDFFKNSVQKILTQWPIDGIIWDELKTLNTEDLSPNAVARKPPGSDATWYTDAVADFFDDVSAHAKSIKPDTAVSLFLYGDDTVKNPYNVERCARIQNIDYFGCDGRPWRMSDDLGPNGDGKNPYSKVLLPNAQEFIDKAHQNGKGGLVLIENFSFQPPEPYYIDLMKRTLPEVFNLRAEHVMYYYYGRSMTDPDAVMNVTAKAIKATRTG
ncbi:hypothetical protein ACNAW0_09440 [Micromonospora sp. SL1-18]|uniref:hypothetical protein n=1 Tax=Micromonospora sp. SL1-18 TaxID=3399128 RepID=UPI003A4E1ECC